MAYKALFGVLLLLCSLQHGLAYDKCNVLLSSGSGSFQWHYANPCHSMDFTLLGSEFYDLTVSFTETCMRARVESYMTPPGKAMIMNYSSSDINGMELSAPPGHDIFIRLYEVTNNCDPPLVAVHYFSGRVSADWKVNHQPYENDPEAEKCTNGGFRLNGTTDDCVCPPGFSGPSCVQACGWNKYGDSCELSCCLDYEVEMNGCRGFTFCAGRICFCAAGYRGPKCDISCSPGQYGSNCTESCGLCINGESCDPTTGHCPGECQPGYSLPPFCQEKLTHLHTAPDILEVGTTSLVGTFPTTAASTRGQGTVLFYQPQYKVKSDPGSGWVSSTVGRFSTDLEAGRVNFAIYNLPPDTDLFVRVLLLDHKMRAFSFPPFVTARTSGRNRVENLKVFNLSARSANLTWDSFDFKQGEYFFVRRECLSLIACPGPCPQPEETKEAASTSFVLEELLPAATYRVTVKAAENHQAVAVFTTDLLPPDASVSSLRVSALTNNSAMLEWGPSAQCDKAFGPTALYEWSLKPLGSKSSDAGATLANTTAMSTVLTELQPLADYQFTVNLFNTEGGSPASRTATLNFSTYHTVPDPPRDLIAYRLNRTAIWLRWREPSRPSGTLREYVVDVAMLKGASARAPRTYRLPAATRCTAWPDQVCYTVTRLRPQLRYTLTVSAVNEHGTKPGEPTSIEASTIWGLAESPQNLRLVSKGTDYALIAWQLPLKINGDLQFFEVAVQRHVRPDEVSAETDVPDPDVQRLLVSKEQPEYQQRVDGLQPGATYSVTVNCGHGGQTAHLEVTTENDPEVDPEYPMVD